MATDNAGERLKCGHRHGTPQLSLPRDEEGDVLLAEDISAQLEEGCALLLVLEASRARIAHSRSGLYETEVHLTEAIGSLRQALALLRERTRDDGTSALANGFVQAIPWRTA